MDGEQSVVFAGFILDPQRQQLQFNGQQLDTYAKVIDFLALLTAQPEALITKEHILDTLWPEQFVSEASISRLVSDTRQLLAQHVPDVTFIQTVRGKGFRFVQPVNYLTRATVADDTTVNEARPDAVTQSERKYRNPLTVLAIAIAVLGITGWFLTSYFSNSSNTLLVDNEARIVVLPVNVTTGDVQDSWAEFGVMSMLTQQLREFPSLQVTDTDSVIRGLSVIPYASEAGADRQFEAVCQALGCTTLVIPSLSIQGGKPQISYQIVQRTFKSPRYQFEHEDVMSAARQMISHAMQQLIPRQKQRLELQPLYSENSQANVQFALGVSALYHADYPTAIQTLSMAVEQHADFFWAKAYLADAHYRQGNYEQAVALIDALQQASPSFRARLFLGNLQSNILYASGELAASIAITKSLLDELKNANEPEWLGSFLMNTGSSYTSLGELDNATMYLRQAIDVFVEAKLGLREAQARLNLGNALFLQSPNSAAAFDQYELAANLFREFGANAYLAYALTAQAQYKRNIGRFTDASTMLDTVTELYQQAGDQEGLLFVDIERADLAVAQQDLQTGLVYAQKAYEGAGDQFTYVRSYTAAMQSLLYLELGELAPIEALLAEQDKYQWFDPRANFVLLRASLAHRRGDLEGAVTLARKVKQSLGEQWTDKHQRYLDCFVHDAQRNQRSAMDYMQGRFKPTD